MIGLVLELTRVVRIRNPIIHLDIRQPIQHDTHKTEHLHRTHGGEVQLPGSQIPPEMVQEQYHRILVKTPRAEVSHDGEDDTRVCMRYSIIGCFSMQYTCN